MEFFFEEVDHNVMIVRVDGGLDSQTAEEFVNGIQKMIDTGIHKIIIDCEKLRSISSYGIGTLIRLHRRMSDRGGDVKIAAVRGPIWDLLRMIALDKVFDIYPDVNRARLEFRPKDSEMLPRQADGRFHAEE